MAVKINPVNQVENKDQVKGRKIESPTSDMLKELHRTITWGRCKRK